MSVTSPILLAGGEEPTRLIVRGLLEDAGLRMELASSAGEPPSAIGSQPVAVLASAAETSPSLWLRYVEQGGCLLLCAPDAGWAAALGFSDGPHVVRDGVLRLPAGPAPAPAEVQLLAPLMGFRHAPGTVCGVVGVGPELEPSWPAVVELTWGRGQLLLLLFPLAEQALALRQRTAALVDGVPTGSAERLARAGLRPDLVQRPQLDQLVNYLVNYLLGVLLRADRPVPRLGWFPCGFRSLVAFSFDDCCASWRPVRRHFDRLRQEGRGAVGALARSLLGYPWNYGRAMQRWRSLLRKYDAGGTAFLLPSSPVLKQHGQRWLGYSAFSRRLFQTLYASGWDMGTHIKPRELGDYAWVRRRFRRHFNLAPRGHRGHELGWVGWLEDWRRLDQLGYLYDSTWNWGGHAGLSWMQGSSLPFHPWLPGEAVPLRLLELPLLGWVEDLSADPQAPALIRQALDAYPGFYQFGAHSWRSEDPAHVAFVEQVMQLARERGDVGVDWTLDGFADYWLARERSGFQGLRWDVAEGLLAFGVDSRSEGDDLTVLVPQFWRQRQVRSIAVAGAERRLLEQRCWGGTYVVVVCHPGRSEVVVRYG